MTLTVLIPTYARPAGLQRCLEGILVQTRTADEVLVVARRDDANTLQMLAQHRAWSQLRVIITDLPGQVNALNIGLDNATGDIVAITDDDASPRPDWLARIEAHFSADPKLGGLGGRDWVFESGTVFTGNKSTVGKIQLVGRMIGNHHLGFGCSREVDYLKGANMSYRRDAIGPLRFDASLRGIGAQICNDMAFSMGIALAGWKVVYDPVVTVDHFPAERTGSDDRRSLTVENVQDVAFNRYWTISKYGKRGWRRFAALAWQSLMGTFGEPGLFRTIFLYPRDRSVAIRWKAGRMGRIAAQKALCIRFNIAQSDLSPSAARRSFDSLTTLGSKKDTMIERSGADCDT